MKVYGSKAKNLIKLSYNGVTVPKTWVISNNYPLSLLKRYKINLENLVALEDYFTTQNNGHKYKNSIQNILINLITDGYFDELITNKKALLYELKETKKYIPSLSETIENLQSIPIEEVNIDSLSEIMKFGDALNGEYELVTSEERKALESDSSA